jgi:hypothetical protein
LKDIYEIRPGLLMLTFSPSQRVVLIQHTDTEVQARVYTVTELIAELTGEQPRNVTDQLSPTLAALLGHNGQTKKAPPKTAPERQPKPKPQISLPDAIRTVLGSGPLSRRELARRLDQMGISYHSRYLSHVLWKQFKHLGHRIWSLPEAETAVPKADKSCHTYADETQATTRPLNRLV